MPHVFCTLAESMAPCRHFIVPKNQDWVPSGEIRSINTWHERSFSPPSKRKKYYNRNENIRKPQHPFIDPHRKSVFLKWMEIILRYYITCIFCDYYFVTVNHWNQQQVVYDIAFTAPFGFFFTRDSLTG